MTPETHLSDDRLIEISLDPSRSAREREHLDACTLCDARRDGVSRLLVEMTGVAAAEADAVFTPERLARQRTRILQRLAQEGRSARIVAFPAGHTHHPRPVGTRPATRWVAGAAAAGLLIGMLAGRLAPGFRLPDVRPASFADAGPAPATLRAASATMSEEEFLGRLELAVESTSGSVLRPLHELTPLVWEVAAP